MLQEYFYNLMFLSLYVSIMFVFIPTLVWIFHGLRSIDARLDYRAVALQGKAMQTKILFRIHVSTIRVTGKR
jgi:hypothetical protein